MNSRPSGDILEYYFAHTLCLLKVKPSDEYTKEKLIWLLEKVDASDNTTLKLRINLLKKISKFIQPLQVESFSLLKDTSGIRGDTTDIRLTTANGDINISLKRNNKSVKHQRPSNLSAQLGTNDNYKLTYRALNAKWYNELQANEIFNNVPADRKILMYREFNKLYARHVNNNQQCRNTFTDFLLSNSIQNKYIVEWNSVKGTVHVYDCKALNYPHTMWAMRVDDTNIMLELFDTDDVPYVALNLRLHNASGRITKTLSIKYDTKILNMKNIYRNYDI